MYSDFYGLKQEPFRITPDPEFLFLSPSHQEALDSIIYGVEKRKGLMVVTGEVGVGKTTVLRSFFENLNKQQEKIVYLFNGNISFPAVLKIIFKELALEGWTGDILETVNHLHLELIKTYYYGKNVILVVDEAQNMPVETLVNLTMLSNLETTKDKLVQIVLVGQPEFDEMLNRPELHQLKQRIAVRCKISPLTRKESRGYIEHRLTRAGMDGKATVFTRGALRRIVKQAKGIPRVLNILCDNALIRGFRYRRNPVTSRTVMDVIADFEGKKPFPWRWGLAPVAALVLVIVLSWVVSKRDSHIIRMAKSDLSPVIEVAQSKDEPIAKAKPLNPEPVLQETPVGVEQENRFPAEKPGNEPFETDLFPMKRIVQEGDNLYRLTLNTYGVADQRLLDWVMENNPHIKDIRRVKVGEKIVFPPPKQDRTH